MSLKSLRLTPSNKLENLDEMSAFPAVCRCSPTGAVASLGLGAVAHGLLSSRVPVSQPDFRIWSLKAFVFERSKSELRYVSSLGGTWFFHQDEKQII